MIRQEKITQKTLQAKATGVRGGVAFCKSGKGLVRDNHARSEEGNKDALESGLQLPCASLEGLRMIFQFPSMYVSDY